MSNYEIKDKNISQNSEVTSAVSTISYEVENAKYNGLSDSQIDTQIEHLIDRKKFPANLEYIDSFYDKDTSSSSLAFLDTNTGNMIVEYFFVTVR